MKNSANTSDLVRQGIAAFKARQHTQATTLFEQALAQNPQDQLAWLWLASCTSCLQEKRKYLRCALDINPNSELGKRAATGISRLEQVAPPASEQHAPAAPRVPDASPPAASQPHPPTHSPPAEQSSQPASATPSTTAGSAFPFLLGHDYFQAAGREYFLFNKKNSAFLKGKAKYPSDGPDPNEGRNLLFDTIAVGMMMLFFSIPTLIVAMSVWAEMLLTALTGEPVSRALIDLKNNGERLVVSVVAAFATIGTVTLFSGSLTEYLDYRRSPPKNWILQGEFVAFQKHLDEGVEYKQLTYRFTNLDGNVESHDMGYVYPFAQGAEKLPPGTPMLVWCRSPAIPERINHGLL